MNATTTASAVHVDAVFSTAHGLPTVNQETSFLGHHVLGLCVSKQETFVSVDGIKTLKFGLRDVNQATSTIDVYCHGAWADALGFIEPGDQAIIIGSRVELRDNAQHLFQFVIHEESVSQPDVMVALNGNRKFLFHISKHNVLTHRAPGQHARRLSKLDNTVPIIPASFHGEDVPYTNLAAAVAAGSSSALINIWAVVGEFSPPRPTKGTDTIVLLTLIDATTPQPVRASLFIKDALKCPRPAAVGDIIRLHRVKLAQWDNKPQIQAGGGFAFLLFHCVSDSSTPYQGSTTERFSWTATDVNQLAAARDWSRTRFVPQAAESLSKSYLRRIDQIPLPDKRFDIVVRVVHVAQQESAGYITVLVWDGTDMPAIAFQSSGHLGLSAPSSRVRRASNVPDLPPPPVGDLVELRVPVGERAILDIVRALKAGDWVKVRNVHSVYDPERGFVHLQICPDSALYAVPCDANLVVALLTHSEERIQGLALGYATPPLTHVQDASGAPPPPLSTIKSMLSDKAEAGKYRLRVRAGAVAPREAVLICRPSVEDLTNHHVEEYSTFHNGLWIGSSGQPLDSATASVARWAYTVELAFYDETAAFPAILCSNDARTFFNGCVPGDLSQDPASSRKLQVKVDALLAEGAWMYVKVAKYVDFNGQTRFRIFDTALQF